ncbi:transaldolase family protein [Halanaerobium sp. ST460_2HS_T2]|jgi:fructose-6-phosphate aldolase 2|uniref:transaldolase family protein n=1 Tax=Halanaerobium sp. ST460_2HS_T2 TaxID=2183914 RepID=UPI000DF210F2|nr:transaldolase family protein [Halanaerobium sp. ST460_2HS_T2]RCW60345.1 fructose-6-phosphate aldolase 2 [Halanaerobium sp. ST460_2HS_T2]
MELYVDSANVEIIKELNQWLPLDGVTVNPSIVAAEDKELFPLLDELLKLSKKHLHVQVLSEKKEEIIKEAEKLHSISEKIVVKIPVSQQGLAAIKELDTEKIKITATAIFTVTQAFSAAKAGAAYLAPYVSRLDRVEQSGVKMVREMQEMVELNDFSAKIITASIKNANQVKELIRTGAQAMTLSPEILIQSHQHPLTDQAVEMFRDDWINKFKNYNLDSKLK